MAWVFLKAETLTRNNAISAARITIHDADATQGEGENEADFAARTRRRYDFTRRRNEMPPYAFTQTPAEFREMVKQEVRAHITDLNTRPAPVDWADATGDFTP